MKPTDVNVQRMIKVIFWFFLVCSPILAYLGGMLYTDVQFRWLTKQVESLPVYPSARLINRDFTDATYNGHSYDWELEYETEDNMKEVVAFYQRILPKSGWRSTPTGGGAYIYESDDLSMLLFQDNSKPGNKTFFGLSIGSGYYSTVFDLRYSK